MGQAPAEQSARRDALYLEITMPNTAKANGQPKAKAARAPTSTV
jgi:hypothetical protein